MPGSSGSAEADDGSGAGSDDESGMSSCRGSSLFDSDPRWSRMTGGTKGWRLRGVEWRVKLGILPGCNASVDAMRRATADGRRKYADLRRRLLVDPHIMDEDQTVSPRMDNPLSQDPESVWGRYFRNAELEKTIDQDLTRLYPEHGVFFQSSSCQAMMRRILLVWSLIHPQFSYRQGMHELLAPLLYVLHVDVVRLSQVKYRFEDLFDDRFDSLSLQEHYVRDKVESAKNFCGEMIVAGDSINFKGGTKSTEESAADPEEQRVDLSVIIQGSDMYGVEGELGALLSARFLEHDAYCMLDALLDGQGGAVAMAEYFQPSAGGGKPAVIEASAAVYRTLAAADLSLYTHLVELGVEPQFFALRWLRLLFGREFILEDLLRIWDAIFEADNSPLYQNGGEDDSEMKVSQRGAIISSFSVSMLLYVRPALLQAPDVAACLQRLLNFPQVPDVKDLIESAKALQLLAQAAVRSPGKPLPRNIRASDIWSGKHVRNGSISPPAPQHNIVRPKTPAPSSPDILKLSMSLPGSYWEEKWTHSVLLKKTPDDLFSPRARTEPVARDFDHVDREGSNSSLTLTRSASEGRQQHPEQAVTSIRSCDSSQDSSDDDGQEMLRRGPDTAPKESIIRIAKSPRPTKEKRHHSRLDVDQDVSLAFASPSTSTPLLEQSRPSVSRSSHRRSVSALPGTVSSEALESALFGDEPAASRDVMDKFEEAKPTTSNLDTLSNLAVQGSDPARAVSETSETSGERSSDEAVAPSGTSSETQDVSHTGLVSMDDNEGNPSTSLSAKDTRGDEESSVLEESNGLLPPELAPDVQPVVDIPSSSVGNEAPEVTEIVRDKEGNGDSQLPEVQSKSRETESTGDHSVEVGISKIADTLPPSKSKPPLPPSRLGRFSWVWNSFGRSSTGEKMPAMKALNEDLPGSDVPSDPSVTASDSEVLNIAAANAAAQRKKRSWWRSNIEVVPEESVASTSTDSGSAVDASNEGDLVPVDAAKDVSVSAVVASGANDLVEDIPVTMQDTTEQPQDMTPEESQPPADEAAIKPDNSALCAPVQEQEPGQDAEEEPTDITLSATLQAQGQDAAKITGDTTQSAALRALTQQALNTPDDNTPSAALQALSQDAAKKPKDVTLQALGQAVLDHVQVLESALAHKVSALDIGNMMWTPAIREKSDNTNKVSLGSKGPGAALAAIAELRKISQALQQM